MGNPDRLEQLERRHRADVAARLPELTQKLKELLDDRAKQIAAFRNGTDSCCGPEWGDFAAWLGALPSDDVLFRLLASFPSINWGRDLGALLEFRRGLRLLRPVGRQRILLPTPERADRQ
jgi:hypothetical protein